jgi:hypothetical protein
MYARTRLGDQAERLRLLEASALSFEKSDDPFIQLAVALLESDLALEQEKEELEGGLERARRRSMEALLAFHEHADEPLYPDANGTLRITYGRVQGYAPRDAVSFAPFTLLQGIAEKHTGRPPFDAPERLLEAIGAGEFGPWGVKDLGSVPVNFVSSSDTTGGNSGSPTLNGNGELVGLLFDGTWEGMLADWRYIPEITRSIHVDIRYVLWLMDYVDRAHHLLKEMGFAPASVEP